VKAKKAGKRVKSFPRFHGNPGGRRKGGKKKRNAIRRRESNVREKTPFWSAWERKNSCWKKLRLWKGRKKGDVGQREKKAERCQSRSWFCQQAWAKFERQVGEDTQNCAEEGNARFKKGEKRNHHETRTGKERGVIASKKTPPPGGTKKRGGDSMRKLKMSGAKNCERPTPPKGERLNPQGLVQREGQ